MCADSVPLTLLLCTFLFRIACLDESSPFGYVPGSHGSFLRPLCRYMGTLGSQVMCDNIPGLVNKQRQLCRQHPKVMQAIGSGIRDWISECQHQFRNHRWNCNTTARDHNLFGRLLLRSE